MFRGFRWQLIALLSALFLFSASLAYRITQTPQELVVTPTQVAQATATNVPPTATSSPPTATIEPAEVIQPEQTTSIPAYSEALIGSVQRLNPLLANLNPVDQDITSLIFEGLIKLNQYGEAVPNLASEWVLSNDGLEYVMILREDILWQDGTPFTADDVVFTMSLLGASDFPGSEELNAFWQTVEVEKLGSHLLRFRLAQPLGSFLNNLTIGILPEHVLSGISAAELASHPFNLAPIGTGPYQLEALRSNDIAIHQVDLRVAPVYQQRSEETEGFSLERVTFKLYATFDDARTALQNGDVDGLAARNWHERIPLLEQPDLNVYTQIAPKLGVLIFNWDEDEDIRFFQERRVRIALQTGLEREGIIQRNMSNLAVQADSPLLPTSWAYSPNLPWAAYNRDLAASTILESNIRLGAPPSESEAEGDEPTPEPSATPEGEPLYQFSILIPDGEPAIMGMANEIASQWSRYSITVTVEAVDREVFQSRIENGEFQTAIVELPIGADPDVYAYWHQDQYPDGLNYGGASDDILSELLERARRDASGLNRVELYAQFQRDFISRAVAIPLYYPLFTYAVRNNIDGVQLGFIGASSDRFRNIQDWSIVSQS